MNERAKVPPGGPARAHRTPRRHGKPPGSSGRGGRRSRQGGIESTGQRSGLRRLVPALASALANSTPPKKTAGPQGKPPRSATVSATTSWPGLLRRKPSLSGRGVVLGLKLQKPTQPAVLIPLQFAQNPARTRKSRGKAARRRVRKPRAAAQPARAERAPGARRPRGDTQNLQARRHMV